MLHFPPGTSKWNKVEHRLFCHITRTWSQAPLLTLDDAVAGIAAATTGQGLKVTAMRDDAEYPVGTEISDRQNKDTEDRFIDRDPGHGGLCYLMNSPRPRADPPGTRTGPAGPDPALTAALAVLAGIPGLQELRERAALDWTAARRAPSSPSNAAAPAARQATPAATAAAATGNCPSRPSSPPPPATSAVGMTWALLGRLYGVHPSSISVPADSAITVLGKPGITRQPGDPRISTPGKLLEHAAAAGITLTIPDTPAGKDGNRHPEEHPRHTRDCRLKNRRGHFAVVDPRSRKRRGKRRANAGITGGHAGFRLPIARMTHDPGAGATPGPRKARDRGATLTQPERPSAANVYLREASRPGSGIQLTAHLP